MYGRTDGRTDGRTFEASCIRSTQRSPPKKQIGTRSFESIINTFLMAWTLAASWYPIMLFGAQILRNGKSDCLATWAAIAVFPLPGGPGNGCIQYKVTVKHAQIQRSERLTLISAVHRCYVITQHVHNNSSCLSWTPDQPETSQQPIHRDMLVVHVDVGNVHCVSKKTSHL